MWNSCRHRTAVSSHVLVERPRFPQGINVVCAVIAILALVVHVGPAHPQTFSSAVGSALNNNCSSLGATTTPVLGPIINDRGDRRQIGTRTTGPFRPDQPLTSICSQTRDTTQAQLTGGSVAVFTRLSNVDEEVRIFQRLQDLRRRTEFGSMAASADTALSPGLSFFASGEFTAFDKTLTTFEPAFHSTTSGGTIGGDYSFSRGHTVGAAINYSHIDGEFSRHGGDFATDSYGGLLYASVLPVRHLFVDLTAGYARKEYSLDRRFSFGNPSPISAGVASGSTNGNEYKAAVNIGYDFAIHRFTFGPRVGLNYVGTSVDGFREHGPTGLELIYGHQHRDSLTSVLGFYGSMALSTRVGVLVPQASVEYVHEFEDDQRTIPFRFVDVVAGPSFHFRTDSPDRDYLYLATGVVFYTPRGVAPFVNYRALVDYANQARHIVTAGVRFEF